jgi:hypothetical protein
MARSDTHTLDAVLCGVRRLPLAYTHQSIIPARIASQREELGHFTNVHYCGAGYFMDAYSGGASVSLSNVYSVLYSLRTIRLFMYRE